MELVSFPAAALTAVAAALLSRGLGPLWLRSFLVLAIAYATAFAALMLTTRGQYDSWTPMLLHMASGAGALVGLMVLSVSHWLLKRRGPRGG